MGVEGADGEAGEGVACEHASSGQHRMMTNTGVTLVPFRAQCTHTHKRAYAHPGARTCPYRVTTSPVLDTGPKFRGYLGSGLLRHQC